MTKTRRINVAKKRIQFEKGFLEKQIKFVKEAEKRT